MLASPDNDNISIHSYYQEILQKFMLVLYVFITHSLTLVYLSVISDIQCYISTIGKTVLL